MWVRDEQSHHSGQSSTTTSSSFPLARVRRGKDEARAAMQAHLDANPKGKHGTHQYDLDSFGLDAARVRERFADYVDRFQVKTS